MLEREQCAGPADAGLHFIEDQQQAVLVAQRTQRAQEAVVRRHDTGLALDRLQHDGHRALCDQGLDRVQVVQRRLRKARHLGFEKAIPARLAAGRHRCERASMKAVHERDDLEGAVAMHLTPLARQLDRAFVGLGAARAKEHPFEPGKLCEPGGKFQRGCIEVRRAGADEPLRLARKRFLNLWRRVPQRVDRPALHEVEVTLAAMVDEPGPVGLRRIPTADGPRRSSGHRSRRRRSSWFAPRRKTKRPRSPRPCRDKPVVRSSTLRARSPAEIRITSLASGKVGGHHAQKCTRALVTATHRNGFRPV